MTARARRIAIVAHRGARSRSPRRRRARARHRDRLPVHGAGRPGGQHRHGHELQRPWAIDAANCGSPYWPWGLMLSSAGTPGTSWLAGQYGEALVSAPPGTLITGGTLTRQMLDYHFEGGKVGSSYGFGYWLRTADGQTIELCGGTGTPPADGCLPQPDGLARFANPVRQLTATKGPPPGPIVTPALRVALGCFLGRSAEGGGGLCYLYTGREALGISPDGAARDRERGAGRALGRRLAALRRARYARATSPSTPPTPDSASSACCSTSTASSPKPSPSTPRGPPAPTSTPPAPTPTSCPAPTSAPPARPRAASRSPACPPTANTTSASASKTPPATPPSPSQRTVTFALPVDGLRCPADGCVVPRPAPNGTNATADASLKATTHGPHPPPRRQGQRTTIAGTLTNPAGAPDHRRHDRRAKPRSTSPGAAWQPAGSARTDAQGRFRYTVPRRPHPHLPLRLPHPRRRRRAGPHRRRADPRPRRRDRQRAPAVRAPRRPRARQRTPARHRRPARRRGRRTAGARRPRVAHVQDAPRPPARPLRLPLPLPPHHPQRALPLAHLRPQAGRPALRRRRLTIRSGWWSDHEHADSSSP